MQLSLSLLIALVPVKKKKWMKYIRLFNFYKILHEVTLNAKPMFDAMSHSQPGLV